MASLVGQEVRFVLGAVVAAGAHAVAAEPEQWIDAVVAAHGAHAAPEGLVAHGERAVRNSYWNFWISYSTLIWEIRKLAHEPLDERWLSSSMDLS